jgi:chorismate mutase
MYTRGIRGAITVEKNNKEDILKETTVLLKSIIKENSIELEDISSIFFSVTSDLNQAFPALAARNLGITEAALLCFHEIAVPNSLSKCLRVLIHINTPKKQIEIKHIYLKKAAALRPDKGLIE